MYRLTGNRTEGGPGRKGGCGGKVNLPPSNLFNTRRWVGEFYPHKMSLRDDFPAQKTIHLRSAHTRRPVCTLRIYTFLVFSLLAQQAPCECSHPGWGGPRDPKEGPQGGRGRRAGGRALRVRTGGRARCARWGPFGGQGYRLYATKAMPNGIYNTDERYPVWNQYRRKPRNV